MEIDTIKVTPVHLKSSPFNNNYLYLHAHLQKYGWYGCNCCGPLHMNQFAGTRGQSRRMEAYSNNFNMIKQFHLYITLFIFSYNACISQTYKLNGYVEDAGSKERLINAKFIERNTKYELGVVTFQCNDPVVENWVSTSNIYEGILFNDNLFEGESYSLSVILNGKDIGPYPNTYYPEPYSTKEELNQKMVFFLYTLSDDYYYFYKSYFEIQKMHDNPFIEPMNVHSNIDGGTGIFAGASVTSDTIIVPNIKLSFWE